MPKRGLSRSELIGQVRDQLDFLDSSCIGFDEGREHEAKRLATSVRVICHQSKTSTSLLRHLGVDEGIMMRDSVPEHFYGVGLPPGALVFGSGLSVTELSETTAEHVPRIRNEPMPDVFRPLEQWSALPVIFTAYGQRPNRMRIVNWLANKTGGTHVDAVPPALAHLLDGSAMGYGFALRIRAPSLGWSPVIRSPMPAAMRQIAEEVRVTLRETFADELT